MNKLLKLVAALSLVLSLSACGGGKKPSSTDKPKTEPKQTEKAEKETEKEPEAPVLKAEANIDPATLDPGKNYSRDLTTSDLWISSTNEEDYFYLVNANTKYYPTGFSITWYYNGEPILVSEQNEIKDMHLINEEGSDLEFDLVFVDLFTAYDFVSDQWFYREGLTALDVESLFFDQYVESAKGNSLTFYDDYTADEVWSGQNGDGNWWAINSTQIIYYPNDGTNSGYPFDFYVTEDNTLDYIDSFEMGQYYVSEY